MNAWYEVISRTLFVRWCCRKLKNGKKAAKKISKKIPVDTPKPDVLYNNSIYTYLINWIYLQNYEVYVLHDKELRRVGMNRYDDFRLMIDEMLNDYFDAAGKIKCRVSPMAMFTLYDYENSPKHHRKVAIIALDETQFTCLTMNTRRYFDAYFGLVYDF